MQRKWINTLVGFFILTIMVMVNFSSCRNDYDFDTLNHELRFSKDTILLDTVFSNSNSETYALKVYNDGDGDVVIPRIHLQNEGSSYFRINVDGQSGYNFNNVSLRENDSLYIFVETAVDDFSDNFVYEDFIVFDANNGQQSVNLTAFLENADYYYPAAGETTFEIDANTTWDNNKSKVIYGDLKIANNSTLTILEGTRVYFHNDSNLEIESGSELNIEGTLDLPVTLRSDRNDPRYDSLPKQWGQIRLNENSLANIHYAVIKGGTTGILAEKDAELNIDNTQIYNMSSVGIFGMGANITGTNVVVSHAAAACLGIENGGTYRFIHSTFANEWPTGITGINGNYYSAYLSNYTTDDEGNSESNPMDAFFGNCIFYGDNYNAVYLDEDESVGFNYTFQNCLVRNDDTSSYDYSTNAYFSNIVFDEPYFTSTLFSDNNLRLTEESAALNQGSSVFVSEAPTDLDGNTRSATPDLGAYED